VKAWAAGNFGPPALGRTPLYPPATLHARNTPCSCTPDSPCPSRHARCIMSHGSCSGGTLSSPTFPPIPTLSSCTRHPLPIVFRDACPLDTNNATMTNSRLHRGTIVKIPPPQHATPPAHHTSRTVGVALAQKKNETNHIPSLLALAGAHLPTYLHLMQVIVAVSPIRLFRSRVSANTIHALSTPDNCLTLVGIHYNLGNQLSLRRLRRINWLGSYDGGLLRDGGGGLLRDNSSGPCRRGGCLTWVNARGCSGRPGVVPLIQHGLLPDDFPAGTHQRT